MTTEIYDYLKHGLVVNIFYLRNRDVLKSQLLDYLKHGVKSLKRKHLTRKSNVHICEYRVYKVLTFFDYIRVSKYYGVFMSMHSFPLIDYLLEHIVSGCSIDCTECNEFDFFTHYAKRVLLCDYTRVQQTNLGYFKVFEKQKFPERYPTFKLLEKSSNIINSMMLLDFDRVYRVVSSRRIASKYGYSYIITLFNYVKHLDYIMISDFWLPKSCLSAIKGSKFVHENGDLDVWDNQFIRVVDTKTYKGNKHVVIKSYLTKSITQLKKPIE